ncbi:amidohydrolase [Brevibacillus humidisoli]|uniref:amidohydrolase n=1 Tax=Brevibacillus humidisoli TaxID=2895522 RepID=UPI001E56A672|nr:amidohydrolase [Brevibacillus humidisoli]UFJ38930.1 amidohydrolase [Brevibacillus humidisoli]
MERKTGNRMLLVNGYLMQGEGEELRFERKEMIVEEGKILKIGDNLRDYWTTACHNEGDVCDLGGKWVIPGLVNTHNHAAMSLLRCFSDDKRLMEWLSQKMLPAESRMTAEDIYWGTHLAMAEMVRSGTTAFADMYIEMDHVAEAVAESGMRASLSRGMAFLDERGEERLREAIQLCDRWHGACDGRITTMLAPHAPYTVPPERLQQIAAIARERKIPIHIHLAETEEETIKIGDRYGLTPTEYLYESGVFEGNHVLLAHAVHVSEADLSLLSGMRGGIAHNPVSNNKLGCGIAPVEAFLKRGITVGLGTDGAGSASSLDLFLTIQAAAWMQKVTHRDPTRLSAKQVLTMATASGADLLAIGDQTGRLEVGKEADLTILNPHAPHLIPHHDLPSLVAYAANGSDVDSVMVAGQWLMRKRELLHVDEERIIYEAASRARRIVDGL